MGNSDSRVSFIAGVQQLTTREVQPEDEFWKLLFSTPLSTEDVFSILDKTFLRKLRDEYPINLKRLLEHIIAQMRDICELVKQKKAPWAEALLCIRLLTRIAPFLQEDPDDEKINALVWDAEAGCKSIGSRIFHYINRFLFLERFTVVPVPGYEASKDEKPPTHRVDARLLWKGGIGSPDTLMGQQTNLIMQQRVEVLRCLLSCLSGPLFQTCEAYGAKPSKWLLAYTSGNQPYTANLFCSLMSTVFTYDPVGWGLPYGGLLSSNIEEELVDYSIQVLCVLIDFLPNEDEASSKVKNVYRYMIKGFSKDSEYDLVFNGLVRLLETIHVAKTTLLPKSKQHVNFYQEALVLLWHLMNVNPGFLKRSATVQDSNKILVPIIYLLQMSRNRPSLVGLLHMSCFILLVFSSSRDFGVRLNQPFVGRLPVDMPRFSGSHADLLVLSAHKIISENLSLKSGDSLTDMLLTVLCNISAYVKSFCVESSLKILQLVERCSKPVYLWRSQHHHQGIIFLLDFLNNIIQYQFEGNAMLVYSCVRQKKIFVALDSLTFEEGQRRVSNVKKRSSAETLTVQETASDAEVAAPPEDTSAKVEDVLIERETKPSTCDRGEPSNGHPGNDHACPEENGEELITADESLARSHTASVNCTSEAGATKDSMEKQDKENLDAEWFETWKSRLTLDTVLRLCDDLGPKIEQFCADHDEANLVELVEFVKQQTMVGLLPVPHPIVIRTYAPNRYTALWFTSYLWGVIFTRSQNLPLYDLDKIKLIVINQ